MDEHLLLQYRVNRQVLLLGKAEVGEQADDNLNHAM